MATAPVAEDSEKGFLHVMVVAINVIVHLWSCNIQIGSYCPPPSSHLRANLSEVTFIRLGLQEGWEGMEGGRVYSQGVLIILQSSALTQQKTTSEGGLGTTVT